jgi:hypothetical protein
MINLNYQSQRLGDKNTLLHKSKMQNQQSSQMLKLGLLGKSTLSDKSIVI